MPTALFGSSATKSTELWLLVTGHSLRRECDDVFRAFQSAALQYDDSLHRLSPQFVRHSDDANLLHSRVAQQHLPEMFCATVARHRVTSTWLVPTQIKMLLRYSGLERWDLSSLTHIVYGGAHMYAADMGIEAVRLEDRLGGALHRH